MFKYIIIILMLLIIFIALYVYNNYQKIKDILKNINSSLAKIQKILDRKEILLKNIIKDTKNKELKIMLKNNNNDIFEKEQTLFNIKWKLEELVTNEKYKPTNEYIEYLNELKSLEEDLEGLKDYYNSKVSLYNEKYLNKLFNKIYVLLKLDKQKKFETKKIESFEILKD